MTKNASLSRSNLHIRNRLHDIADPAARRQVIGRACVEVLEERRLMSFTPGVDYTVQGTHALVTGDFNNDQKLDIATTDSAWGGVIVLPGNGDGTFQSPVTTPSGAIHSVAVGDFNDDANLDLAAASYAGVGVMLGNGDGTFQPATDINLGTEPTSIAVGDFNGDGTLDLGATSTIYHNYYGYSYYPYGYGYYEGNLNVLIGTGDGTFNTPTTHSTGTGYLARGIAADLNGDGVDDLAAANLDYGTVEILYGSASQIQSTSSIALDFVPGTIAAGDMNGDLKNDLVITAPAYYADSRFGLLLGNGAGGFEPMSRHAGAGGYWLVLKDFDNDERLDLAISASTNVINIIRRNEDGGYGPTESNSAPNAHAITADDLNGDGWVDLAAGKPFGPSVSVMMNDGIWPAPAPTLSINDIVVTEGDSGSTSAVFTVTRSGNLAGSATVNYNTANSSAIAGSDYVAKSGTLTFAAGVATLQVTVAVNGDLVDEYDQSFFINLSSASGAVITDVQGVCLIADNDPPPTMSITQTVSRNEGNGKGRNSTYTSFSFTVTLSAASEKGISVSYATADGTAKAGEDYLTTAGSLYFAPGVTSRTITVQIIADSVKESNETFAVKLTSVSNAVLLTSQGIGEILNDDKR